MGTHYKGKPAEVRALNAFIKLTRATKSVTSRIERSLTRERLTDSQFGVLEALLHLGPMCQRELGHKLLTSGANVTTVIDNLEKRDLVSRARENADRRFVTVRLTEPGRALVSAVLPGHVEELVAAFSGLTAAEQQQLEALCKKLGLQAAAEDDS